MISLRRHVLTIVAVFLAVALGVVIGSTSVATWLGDATSAEGRRTTDKLDRATAELEAARSDARRLDGMAASLSPAVVPGALDKRPVLVVLAPGAPAQLADEAVREIRAAGGLESGRIVLTDKAVDPASDTEIQSLVANVPLGEPAPGADIDLGTQLGRAVGRAALLRPTDAKPLLSDKDRDTVLTTLKQAGVLSYDAGTVRPGQLVLLVTGDDGGRDGQIGSRLAALGRELDRIGAGTVVAAQVADPSAGGPVTSVRTGPTGTSSVDDLDSAAGRLAVVLALAEQLRGRSGAYGLRSDATAALPEAPGSGERAAGGSPTPDAPR